MTTTCTCPAYPFPHRLLGGKCTHVTAGRHFAFGGHDYCNSCPHYGLDHETGLNYCLFVDGAVKECDAINLATLTGVFPK